MSASADRIVQALNARRVRDGQYRAKCPVHSGHSDDSLSITDSGDRCLIHCFSGCDYRDILEAVGMSAKELFESVSRPDPVAQWKVKARRDLERWADSYTVVVTGFLRDLDGAIRLASSALSMYEDGKFDRNPELEEIHWDLLARAYTLRTQYEYHFDVLNTGTLQDKLNLWRELTQ